MVVVRLPVFSRVLKAHLSMAGLKMGVVRTVFPLMEDVMSLAAKAPGDLW